MVGTTRDITGRKVYKLILIPCLRKANRIINVLMSYSVGAVRLTYRFACATENVSMLKKSTKEAENNESHNTLRGNKRLWKIGVYYFLHCSLLKKSLFYCNKKVTRMSLKSYFVNRVYNEMEVILTM